MLAEERTAEIILLMFPLLRTHKYAVLQHHRTDQRTSVMGNNFKVRQKSIFALEILLEYWNKPSEHFTFEDNNLSFFPQMATDVGMFIKQRDCTFINTHSVIKYNYKTKTR